MARDTTIEVRGVDHIGIRVKDLTTALRFYGILGFDLVAQSSNDDWAIIRNREGVEINLIFNSNNANEGRNILMDVPDKYPGYTHVALAVASVKATVAALDRHGIKLSGGPVELGGEGKISVFVRDPDRNVIELRGRD